MQRYDKRHHVDRSNRGTQNRLKCTWHYSSYYTLVRDSYFPRIYNLRDSINCLLYERRHVPTTRARGINSRMVRIVPMLRGKGEVKRRSVDLAILSPGSPPQGKRERIYWVSDRVRKPGHLRYSICGGRKSKNASEICTSFRVCVYVRLNRDSCRPGQTFQSRLYLVELGRLPKLILLAPGRRCFPLILFLFLLFAYTSFS